ncbi:MAG: DUF4350 domain-containing protein, partial [Pirellulales bacterium]
IEEAQFLFEIAPYRGFSARQMAVVERWVEAGGELMVTAGAEQAGGVNRLLERFRLHVPPSPLPPGSDRAEPLPMGSFDAQFYSQDEFRAYVHFWDAWRVEADDPAAAFPAYKYEHGEPGYGENTPLNEDVPVAAQVPVGEGHVTLFGDSSFLLNKTFRTSIQPHANAYYWRWLLSRIDQRKPWNPSPGLFPEETPRPDDAGDDADGEIDDERLGGLQIPEELIEPD